ncbi:MAG: exonuclease SbcCD subunit D [Deltaproteobacteria bacterium]|nr:exonuclease SbcCD subunit D [Deltaproteobacteria bacterium]
MLRFIHTADWHLGRLFHGVSLTDDQAYVLDQLVRLVVDVKPDALLIAGDIYDRAVPAPLAVKLLNEVLSSITADLNVPVVMISGNHDSPERLGFGSRLLSRQGLFIFGRLSRDLRPVLIMGKGWGLAARIYALPYDDAAAFMDAPDDGSAPAENSGASLGAVIRNLLDDHPPDECAVCVSHAFIAGATAGESERPLSVGGAAAVDAALFKDFDYAAMGHLHRPQSAGGETIQYAGSLLKYAFSEADQVKSVNLVEMDRQGLARCERIPLAPRRDVRIREGTLADILKGPASGENREDYLMVRLLDKGAILDAMGKIREVYPNCLHIERPSLLFKDAGMTARTDHTKTTGMDLFKAFFVQTTGEELSEGQARAFASVADELDRSEREAP